MKRARMLLYALLPLYGILTAAKSYSLLVPLDDALLPLHGILAAALPGPVPDLRAHYDALFFHPNALAILYGLVLIDMLRPETHVRFLIAVAVNVAFWLPIAHAAGWLLDLPGRRRRRGRGAAAPRRPPPGSPAAGTVPGGAAGGARRARVPRRGKSSGRKAHPPRGPIGQPPAPGPGNGSARSAGPRPRRRARGAGGGGRGRSPARPRAAGCRRGAARPRAGGRAGRSGAGPPAAIARSAAARAGNRRRPPAAPGGLPEGARRRGRGGPDAPRDGRGKGIPPGGNARGAPAPPGSAAMPAPPPAVPGAGAGALAGAFRGREPLRDPDGLRAAAGRLVPGECRDCVLNPVQRHDDAAAARAIPGTDGGTAHEPPPLRLMRGSAASRLAFPITLRLAAAPPAPGSAAAPPAPGLRARTDAAARAGAFCPRPAGDPAARAGARVPVRPGCGFWARARAARGKRGRRAHRAAVPGRRAIQMPAPPPRQAGAPRGSRIGFCAGRRGAGRATKKRGRGGARGAPQKNGGAAGRAREGARPAGRPRGRRIPNPGGPAGSGSPGAARRCPPPPAASDPGAPAMPPADGPAAGFLRPPRSAAPAANPAIPRGSYAGSGADKGGSRRAIELPVAVPAMHLAVLIPASVPRRGKRDEGMDCPTTRGRRAPRMPASRPRRAGPPGGGARTPAAPRKTGPGARGNARARARTGAGAAGGVPRPARRAAGRLGGIIAAGQDGTAKPRPARRAAGQPDGLGSPARNTPRADSPRTLAPPPAAPWGCPGWPARRSILAERRNPLVGWYRHGGFVPRHGGISDGGGAQGTGAAGGGRRVRLEFAAGKKGRTKLSDPFKPRARSPAMASKPPTVAARLAPVLSAPPGTARARRAPGRNGPDWNPATVAGDPADPETKRQMRGILETADQLMDQNQLRGSSADGGGGARDAMGRSSATVLRSREQPDPPSPPMAAVGVSGADGAKMSAATTKLVNGGLRLPRMGIDPPAVAPGTVIGINRADRDAEKKIGGVAAGVVLTSTRGAERATFRGARNQSTGHCGQLMGGSSGECGRWGLDCAASVDAVRNAGSGTENGITMPGRRNPRTASHCRPDDGDSECLAGSEAGGGGWFCD